MQKTFWKGTRLLEIVFYGSILIILLILTVPYFDRFQCKSRQSEARMELMNLYQAQGLYRATHQRHASLEALQKSGLIYLKNAKGKYYQFQATQTPKDGFRILAIGHPNGPMKQDSWSIDQTGKLKHLSNACSY